MYELYRGRAQAAMPWDPSAAGHVALPVVVENILSGTVVGKREDETLVGPKKTKIIYETLHRERSSFQLLGFIS